MIVSDKGHLWETSASAVSVASGGGAFSASLSFGPSTAAAAAAPVSVMAEADGDTTAAAILRFNSIELRHTFELEFDQLFVLRGFLIYHETLLTIWGPIQLKI